MIFLEKKKQKDKGLVMKNIEEIKHKNKLGREYFLGRELQIFLRYKEWRNFKKVLNKAMKECDNKNHKVSKNFCKIYRKISYKPYRNKEDYILSKYACYLIIKNSTLKLDEIKEILKYFRRE